MLGGDKTKQKVNQVRVEVGDTFKVRGVVSHSNGIRNATLRPSTPSEFWTGVVGVVANSSRDLGQGDLGGLDSACWATGMGYLGIWVWVRPHISGRLA